MCREENFPLLSICFFTPNRNGSFQYHSPERCSAREMFRPLTNGNEMRSQRRTDLTVSKKPVSLPLRYVPDIPWWRGRDNSTVVNTGCAVTLENRTRGSTRRRRPGHEPTGERVPQLSSRKPVRRRVARALLARARIIHVPATLPEGPTNRTKPLSDPSKRTDPSGSISFLNGARAVRKGRDENS